MRTPYRLELYNRSFEFEAFAPLLNQPEVEVDYMSLTNNYATIRKMDVSKGSYARIVNNDGELFAGIVTDTEIGKETMRVTIAPLLSFLDVNYRPQPAATTTVEAQLEAIVNQAFVENEDTLQNITGLEVSTTTETAGAIITEEEVNLYDLACTALNTYGIVCDFRLNIPEQKLELTIGSLEGVITIEADLKTILSSSFVIGDGYGELNKLICQYTHDVTDEETGETETITETLTFYKHPDGTVDQNDENRIQPVVFDYEDISLRQEETFEEVALQKAKEEMSTEYRNEIQLQVAKGNKLLQGLSIGQSADIIRGDKVYRSILTAYEMNESQVAYTFGTIRSSLTKKLWIERRGNK